MEQVIECPSCQKRYKLKGTPPPTFECRNCGTVMDLSAFREAAPAPAAPVAPAQPKGGRRARGGAPAGGAVPHRRAHRRSGSASRARRHGRDDPGMDQEEGHHHYTPRDKGPNMPLIFGSLGALLVVAVLLFFFMSAQQKKRDEEERKKAEAEAAMKAAAAANAPPPIEEQPLPEPEPEPVEKPKPVDVEDARPELREGDLRALPIPEGKTRYMVSKAEMKTYEYPDHVTAEEKAEIEKHVEMLLMSGRDQRDAEKYFKKLDGFPKPGEELKAVGRLISEFPAVVEEFGLTGPEAMSRLRVIDKTLRSIDGMQERDFRDIDGINIASDDRMAMRVIKRWNWWWDLHKWQLRRQPWDPREDMLDELEGEGIGDD